MDQKAREAEKNQEPLFYPRRAWYMQTRGRAGGGWVQRTLFNHRGMHWKGESNTVTKIQSPSPSNPGRLFYSRAGNRERQCGNQTCTFIPHYGYIHILIGCFTEDNYLLEYRIPKWASGWRNEKKGQKERAELCKGANDIQSGDCVSSAWWQRPIIMNHWLSATDK